MNDLLKEEIEALLNNFWILKDENIELYYRIKRHQEDIRNFTSKNLGSRLIIHERFIKLEKIPTLSNSSLGINAFKAPMDYTFLCLVLLFLEDKTRGNYFMLSSLIDYVKNTAVALELNNIPDWTLGSNRRSLKRAIDFLIDIGAVKLKDENKVSFNEDASAEALYEATGLSNYVMRMFNNEIYNYHDNYDFVKDEWANQDEERGDIRKYKVYRNLLYTPCILTKDISESEIDYLKKLRAHIKEELTDLGLELEVTRNLSFVYEYESSTNSSSFPNAKRITNVVLIVNNELFK
ncbi:MAG: TIGR02678 family protein, partial [Bacilli bacterium]|nr:TIGR02678 family protein [Bacilli bacterium]